MGSGEPEEKQSAARASIVGFLLVVAYSIAGGLQILVWNPLAAAPGATLEEIRADMAQANESLAAPLVISWVIIGVVLATTVLIGGLMQRISAKGAALLSLLLLVLAAPSHWFVAFPAGMGIADTFAAHGGDHAPWGTVLYAVSAVALAALVLILVPRRETNDNAS